MFFLFYPPKIPGFILGEWIIGDWIIRFSLARQFLYSTYFRGKKWVEADARTRHFLRLLWNKIHPSSLLGNVINGKQIRSTSQNPSEFSMVLGFPMVFHGFHGVFMNFSMVFSYLVDHGL